MKRTDRKSPGFGGTAAGGAAVALAGGYQEAPPKPPAPIVPPTPAKRPRGTNVIRVAKIDPEKGRVAIIPIPADMRSVKRAVGAKHVGQQLVSSIGSVNVFVCCNNSLAEGKIWRVRGSLPVRGRAILYGNAGVGPADFPGDKAWLERMIDLDPEGATRAINDPKGTHDEGAGADL